jgi:hypothetical protein
MVRAARPAPVLRRARLAVTGAFFIQGLTAGSLLGRAPALQERYSLNATAVTALIAALAAAAGTGNLVAATAARRADSATVGA